MEAPEIRDQTLQQLDATLLKMTSPEWDLALVGQPQDVVTQAAKALSQVQSARLQLGNTDLSEIRDKLVENEGELEAGRLEVTKVLGKFETVETALGVVSSFLGIVERVVALV